MKVLTAAMASAMLIAFVPSAQAARLRNAKVEEKQDGNLAAAARTAASEGVWLAWDVPSNAPESQMCCFDEIRSGIRRGGVCSLDGNRDSYNVGGIEGTPADTVNGATFEVFLRFEAGSARVRMYSAGCTIEAGGARVIHLENVSPEASASYLASLVRGSKGERRRRNEGSEQALAAIAMHRSNNAIPILESLATEDAADDLRAHAAFWLGMKGGDRGRAVLRRAIDANPSEEFRNQAIAGIAQDHEGRAAIDLLIQLGRTHPSPDVRRQSIFWLGQRAGEKVSAQLAAATNDPDDEVKEMAVFAISQLPRDSAVPQLIELAKTHKSRQVRERAVFWLGQSGDPRALDFIEQVLTR